MCANAVGVAINKLKGIESVKVSLKRGLAEVRLKPGSKVGLAEVRRAVEDQGFEPREARVEVRGRVSRQGDNLWLVVPESEDRLRVEGAELQQHLGKMVEISGAVAPREGKNSEEVLRVQSAKPVSD